MKERRRRRRRRRRKKKNKKNSKKMKIQGSFCEVEKLKTSAMEPQLPYMLSSNRVTSIELFAMLISRGGRSGAN